MVYSTQVTELTVHLTEVPVSSCHMNMVRSKLFQKYGPWTIMVMSCLRQVTLVMVYPTQVITRNDDINMLRPEGRGRWAVAQILISIPCF